MKSTETLLNRWFLVVGTRLTFVLEFHGAGPYKDKDKHALLPYTPKRGAKGEEQMETWTESRFKPMAAKRISSKS